MSKFTDRTGERKQMNNGLPAEIVAYRGNRDIGVRFDNGDIAKHKQYKNFRAGLISAPMHVESYGSYAVVSNPNTGFQFLVDAEDIPLLDKVMWNDNGYGYARNHSLGLLHCLIIHTTDGMDIDHRNGRRWDNRKRNLRVCANAENARNRDKPRTNTSGYKGATWCKGRRKWQAQIGANGKNNHLGYYDTPEQAAQAYDEAAVKYHGEYARTNEIHKTR